MMRTPAIAAITCFAFITIAHANTTVEGSVTLDEPKPHRTEPGYKPQTSRPVERPESFVAVVYLESESGAYPAPRADLIKIEQKGYQFRPAVSAVQTGSRVLFPNMDEEFHNVFSYSKTKRFDLGRFRREDDSPAIVFDKAGLVKIYCEIHQHMRCVLLVVDTPWFATTDASGRFKINRVPPGSYLVKAFLPSEKTISTPVKVPSSGKVTVEFNR
jgi:plastocyanin